MQSLDRSRAADALVEEYGLLNRIIGSLIAADLLEASGCRGWTNLDLIFHMLLDAQRALVTFNTPGAGPPDKDFVSYWKGFDASDEDSQSHGRFVRISAAAHRDPQKICSRWVGTAEAAIRSCGITDLDLVSTQGHVLGLGDFIGTLVVEAAIHHLDLVKNLPTQPGPATAALSIATATIDGLMTGPRPSQWDDVSYILKATGREALSDEDRRTLGAAAGSLPVFS